MEVVRNILLHISLEDICTRILFGIVDNFGCNCTPRLDVYRQIHQEDLLHGTTGGAYTLPGRSSRFRQPDSTTIVTSASNDAEHAATGDRKEPQKASTGGHVNYTILFDKAETITPQSVAPIRVIAAMILLVPFEAMRHFREWHCCILIRGMIDVTLRSPVTIMLTNSTNQPSLIQKHMRGQSLLSPLLRLLASKIRR